MRPCKIHRKKIVKKSKPLIFLFIFLCTISAMGIVDSYSDIIPQDRRIDWNPGVPGGIPHYPVTQNAITDHSAAGDGVQDDTDEIQACLNACGQGEACYLPTGIFKTSKRLLIPDKVVLRGAGRENTKILGVTSNDWEGIFEIKGNGLGAETNISSSLSKGATSIPVQSALGFFVNDYILIDQTNDSNLVDGWESWLSRDNGTRLMGQIVKIKAINGNTLTIDPGVYMDYSISYTPQAVKINNPKEYSGIEDLYVERTDSGDNIIEIAYCAYCWVRNIECTNSRKHHIEALYVFRCEIRDSYFHHFQTYTNGGFGYGVGLWNKSTDVLVENNIFHYTRHAMLQAGAGGGNVFGYNYSNYVYGNYDENQKVWMMCDMSNHGAHPHMTLWEGNMANHIGPDYTHGSSSHNTYFRNFVDADSDDKISHLISVDIQAYNYYMNIIGNVLGPDTDAGQYELENDACNSYTKAVYKLGYTGDGDCSASGNDSGVLNTILRHGNYDYITDSTVWALSIPDHNLPNSLYLSSKPAFFGDLQWPPIGPDLAPKVGLLPAYYRFHHPLAPKNLRIK